MSDNITLPREVVEDVLYALVSEQSQGGDDCYADSITALRTALAAEQPVPTDKDSLTVRSRKRTRKKRLQDDGWKKTREICS